MSLCKDYANSNRVITADNFFTSVSLTEKLWNIGLKYVGTVRKNKSEIPNEFQPERSRQVSSSLFAFDNFKTLVSFVPKTSKAVILLSTYHHDDTITQSESKKPLIISYYNSTKGGVDKLDQMVESYTCRRKTNRWTLNVLMNILDISALNAYILGKIRQLLIKNILLSENKIRFIDVL